MASIADLFFTGRLNDGKLQIDAKKSGDKAGQTMGSSMAANIKKSFSGQELGKGLTQGLGIAGALGAANLAATAVSTVTDVMGDAVNAASTLNETMTKSEVIFGSSADAVSEWADTAASSFGQSKRQALDTASGFAGLFDTVGIELGKATDMAQDLTVLGSDLASFFDTDVQTAIDALRSGLSGESEPLRKFNVFLSETAVNAKLLQMGQKKLGGTWTEAQKSLARYNLILEQTGSAQGDFARTSEGLANSQRTLSAQWEDSLAKLGNVLLPLVARGVSDLSFALNLLNGKLPATNEGFEGIIDTINGLSFNPLTFATQSAFDTMDQAAAASAQRTIDAFKGMVDAVKDDVYDAASSTAPLRYATERIGKTADEAADLYDQAMEDIVNSVIDATDDLETAATDAAAAVFDPLENRRKLEDLDRDRHKEEAIRDAAEQGSKEREESQKTLDEINQDTIDVLAKLAEAGDAEALARLEAFAETERASGRLSGLQIGYINALILKIKIARGEFAKLSALSFMADAKKDDVYIPPKAAGGPVSSGMPYWVGEKGPELFVPTASGQIIPTQSAATVSTGTGNTYVKNYNVNVEGLVKAPTPFKIASTMERFENAGLFREPWHDYEDRR